MEGGQPPIPAYNELMWPTVLAVRSFGHSARLEEIDEAVILTEGFSEEQMAVPHNDGPRTKIEYRMAWARTYLKKMGVLDNPTRGTWVTTDLGKRVDEGEVHDLWKAYQARQAEERRKRAAHAGSSDGDPPEPADPEADGEGEGWREDLLRALLNMDPSSFEHLSKRLLRAAGFINTTVTGGAGDGGIDGVGVYRVSLVSFPVYFQCKRYKGTVGPEKVRDFRGAMQGRGDKGLLITTGRFTDSAEAEATRDGAPPIDLIDGERLCDLLKEHQLGVETTTRTVEEVRIRSEFFADPE